MRIKECIVLSQFQAAVTKRYGLKCPIKHDVPTVVFGLFHQHQVDAIARRKSLTVIVWIGSDTLYMRQKKHLQNKVYADYSKILHAPHVKHVVISKDGIDDLSACGVPHIYLPVTCVDEEKFLPTPLGKKIYCYCPKQRPKLYGRAIIDEVKKRLPEFEFIESDHCDKFSAEQMPEIYRECFLGLRPTIHDGEPTTVAELGLMGRKTVHNGESPAAIHWKGVNDIVASIQAGYQKSWGAKPDFALARHVKEFHDIGEDWLDTNFYV